jgi:hypothetical protein
MLYPPCPAAAPPADAGLLAASFVMYRAIQYAVPPGSAIAMLAVGEVRGRTDAPGVAHM